MACKIFQNIHITLLLVLVFATSCVPAPKNIDANVVSSQEVKVATYLQNGRFYLNSGRFDLAEGNFRRALIFAPDNAAIYNDLGLSLQRQKRLAEALESVQKAVALEPELAIYQINLAALYYDNQQYSKGIDLLTALLFPEHLATENSAEFIKKQLSPFQLTLIYRTLATLYYAQGDLESAICYSEKAAFSTSSDLEAGIHIRLLLTNEYLGMAYRFTQRHIENAKSISPRIMLDYGIEFVAKEQMKLAFEASRRVLSDNSSPEYERRTAYFILLSAKELAEQERAALIDELLMLSAQVCEDANLQHADYWPWVFSTMIKQTVDEVCYAN
ncbi:MAG: tetratricopeptide repeat protein [Deltaproteobacteria bacterium]|nr:tetratricopeptide repeat protein [Deltaproteobacteria bacterium]